MAITTKDCKEAIIKWLKETKDSDCYFYDNGKDLKRIWKRKTITGQVIRAFRSNDEDDQPIFVIEHNNCLVVTPNHPDLIWTFQYDEEHQDDRDPGVMFEFHPEDEDFARTLGYSYGALQYLFGMLPDTVHETMENCILFESQKEETEAMLLSLGFKKIDKQNN